MFVIAVFIYCHCSYYNTRIGFAWMNLFDFNVVSFCRFCRRHIALRLFFLGLFVFYYFIMLKFRVKFVGGGGKESEIFFFYFLKCFVSKLSLKNFFFT